MNTFTKTFGINQKHIINHNFTANWKEVLVQNIPVHHLPVHYGGTRTGVDGDPKCSLEVLQY